jgi:hypothetical protein
MFHFYFIKYSPCGDFFMPIYWLKHKEYSKGMKLLIWIGITVGGGLGSWLGAAMDHGNYFGALSILLGAVGSIAGLWAGYKIGKNYLG